MKISLRRFIYFLILGLLTATAIAACNRVNNTPVTQQQPGEDCRVVQHTMGETCIPRNPQRVLSLSEDIYVNALELGVRSIATTSVPGFPFPKYLRGKVEQLESVGNYNAVNLEKILVLKPDLILARPELEGVYQAIEFILWERIGITQIFWRLMLSWTIFSSIYPKLNKFFSSDIKAIAHYLHQFLF